MIKVKNVCNACKITGAYIYIYMGGGNWLRHNVGNIYLLNHEGKPMDITQTLCKIYASERLNLSQDLNLK